MPNFLVKAAYRDDTNCGQSIDRRKVEATDSEAAITAYLANPNPRFATLYPLSISAEPV